MAIRLIPDRTLRLLLQIPDNLTPSGRYYWEVTCVGSGGSSYTCPFVDSHGRVYPKSGSLTVVSDVTTIFVQTDKAIYKPGQMGVCLCVCVCVNCFINLPALSNGKHL